MKKTLTILGLAVVGSTSANAALILTAIYDGDSSSPKGVEIYVTRTGDYNGWSVDIQFNAATSWTTGYTFDTTNYVAGTFLQITSTDVAPELAGKGTIVSDNSFSMNGNDRVRIFDGTTTIDRYGVADTDGTGTSWEYLDSYAVRNNNTAADGGFAEANWTIHAPNTLNGDNTPLTGALNSFIPVPEPSSVALLGPGGLALLLLRRK